MKDLLIELKRRGKTILLSSHLLSDVEDVCDRMTILYGGKIHAEGTADELLVDTDRTIIRIPRIRNDDTISKIEQILQQEEGTSIESVEQPRQNLESFFIEIVDRARQAKIETSGVKGGTTAPFLKGDEEGDVLIDKLIDHAVPSEIASVEPTNKQSQHQDEEKEVLKTLMKADEVEEKAKEASTKQEVSERTDATVIDSLLHDQEDEHPQDNK